MDEVQELLTLYQPPDWLTCTVNRISPYVPQLGDEVNFILAPLSDKVVFNSPLRRSAIGQFFFSLFLVIIPEVFAKVNSAQFPSRIFDQSRKETFVWLASVQSPYRAQMSKQRWLLSETLLWQDRHLWLQLCVYKKSFIDRKIAVSDLKHACLSSSWVSCHVNVLYLAHRRPVEGWSSFEVRVINLSRSKLRVLRKVRKRKKVELFAPAQTKVSCLTNHNRQTNQWTGETSKWNCEAKCLGGKARVE